MLSDFGSWKPKIHSSAYVHESAVIIGRVRVASKSSIWPLAVLRGDVDRIEIGEETNIQDSAVLHGRPGRPVVLGNGITVGHGAVLHGCRIGDNCLVGMKAVIMESAIGRNSLIAAGSLIPPGSIIPPGSLVMGIPGKIVRKLTAAEISRIRASRRDYLKMLTSYKK